MIYIICIALLLAQVNGLIRKTYSIRSNAREKSERKKDDEKDKAPNLEKMVAAAAALLLEGDGRILVT